MLFVSFLSAPQSSQRAKTVGTVFAGYEPMKYRTNSKWWGKPVPELIGETVQERTDYMLKKYWHDPKIWHKIWKEQWIKTEVLVAIAWADSHLWYATKSKNNVGNVGNNDRWDTVEYPTLEAGIRAMGSYALNGTYLSHKRTIWELSCWWYYSQWLECIHPVYATSAENWNINVLNLLSAIYWETVWEDFEFRM